MNNIFIIITTIASLFFAQDAHSQIKENGKAGLIITPTRIELEGGQRSASVTIANNGEQKGSYKIQFINKIMTEDGRVIDTTPADKQSMFADSILRISPRRISLEPGANQSIRILLRKPKDLPEGEYRTHLSVMTVSEDTAETDDKVTKNNNLIIALKANYGVTIPIIIRNGNVHASGEIENLKYHPGNANVTFDIARNGNKSLYGDIKIINFNNKGEESTVKFLGGMAIYTPNILRRFDVPIDTKGIDGTLRVIYQEKEISGGKVIAQGDLKL